MKKLHCMLIGFSLGLGAAVANATPQVSLSNSCLECEMRWIACLRAGYTTVECNRRVRCMLC